MILMFNIFFSMIFMFLNHPMSMGLILLLQTINISMITGMLNSNFWFSYILFLIMVGGMLVLFIYMTSIASNEIFYYSNKITLTLLLMLCSLSLIWFFLDFWFYSMNFNYLDSTLINFKYRQTTQFNLTKYFNYPSLFMIFFMVIYLFITLIAVVKITKIEFGPLRHKY